MPDPSSSLPTAKNWFSSLLFPEICRICRTEQATARDGYVGPECWRTGVQMIMEPYCECCGLPFEGAITQQFTCANCQEEELHFRSARAGAHMKGVVQEVIHHYKYNQALYFEPFLLKVIYEASADGISSANYDLIIPIPMHWLKRYVRQYNQAVRLGRALAKACGVPCRTDLLKRIQPTPSQTRLTRKARAENVRTAFSYKGNVPLNGERILLVDDVLTTGATASACAKELLKNGASLIDVWTVARGTTVAQTTTAVEYRSASFETG